MYTDNNMQHFLRKQKLQFIIANMTAFTSYFFLRRGTNINQRGASKQCFHSRLGRGVTEYLTKKTTSIIVLNTIIICLK